MSRYSVACILTSLLLVVAPHAAEGSALGASSSDFDPSGDYHIVDRKLATSIGNAYFAVEVRTRRGVLVAWGHVYANTTFFPIKQITLTHDRIAFTTRSIRGILFRFDGEFTRTGVFARQFEGNGIIAARGTLTRVMKGQVDVSVTSEFLYYPGC